MTNKLTTRRSLSVMIGLIFWFGYSGVIAQTIDTTKKPETGDEIIESFTSSKVLNMVMPKTVVLSEEITTALTVRIEPSFEEEFQYVFLKRRNGGIELIKRRSASGNIHYKLADLEQTSALTVVEMAKLIHVLENRRSIDGGKFKELIDDLDLAVREHERRELAKRQDEQRRQAAGEKVGPFNRDGTRYVIWMGGEKTHDITTSGNSYRAPAPKDDDPLIEWVRKLVREL
jgi:hypothetical protein